MTAETPLPATDALLVAGPLDCAVLDAPLGGLVVAELVPSFLSRYLTPKSRSTAFSNLRRAAKLVGQDDPHLVPWHVLQYAHMTALRARLVEHGFARRTVNSTLDTLRRLLRHAWRAGLISSDAAERAADVPNVKGWKAPPGRHITRGELVALFDAADHPRDVAMLAILRLGLRRAEVVGLDLGNYDAEDSTLRFRGKAGKELLVPLPPSVVAPIEAWLEVRGRAPGPLLQPITRSGRPASPARRLSEMALWVRLVEIGKRARVRAFSPHDFRRTVIGDMLDEGVELKVVKDFIGHENINTTAGYDRRPGMLVKKATERIYVPTRRVVPDGR